MAKQGLDGNALNGIPVTSADIRQIKMNYLQHNKNQLPTNGPISAKNLEGKTGSQVTLQQNINGKRMGVQSNNLFTQNNGPSTKTMQMGTQYNNNEFAPPVPGHRNIAGAIEIDRPDPKKEERHP